MVSLLKLLALGAAVCADDAADGFKNTTGADELRTFVGGATIFAIEWTDGVPTGWAFAGGDNTCPVPLTVRGTQAC